MKAARCGAGHALMAPIMEDRGVLDGRVIVVGFSRWGLWGASDWRCIIGG